MKQEYQALWKEYEQAVGEWNSTGENYYHEIGLPGFWMWLFTGELG